MVTAAGTKWSIEGLTPGTSLTATKTWTAPGRYGQRGLMAHFSRAEMATAAPARPWKMGSTRPGCTSYGVSLATNASPVWVDTEEVVSPTT